MPFPRNTTHICVYNHHTNGLIFQIPVCLAEILDYPENVFICEENMTIQPAGRLQSGNRVRSFFTSVTNGHRFCYRPVLRDADYYLGKWAYVTDGDVITLTEKLD